MKRNGHRNRNSPGGWIGLLMILLLSCSGGEQRNDRPLLTSNWGGTAGGPINGRLEVQVFDDTTRDPFPGVLVSLGDSGRITTTTDGQGIAVFTGVIGPQDVHVYFCGGCDADAANPVIPVLYRIASYYQVNARQVSIPIIPGDRSFTEAVFQGKVFDVERDESVFVSALDELGVFDVLGPLGSTTYHWVTAESQLLNDPDPPPIDLTFVFTRDLDEWAAADPDGGRQGFNQVALIGKAINVSKQPQAGVRVGARYFGGNDAGRPYYFDEAGRIDPSLEATTADGRFLFLRLSSNNDVFVSARQIGVGVGARYIHLPVAGTTVFTLPVLPIIEQAVDLSGRVVVYRPDFQEEERKGFLSSENVGVEGVLINFSGDPVSEIVVTDSGAEIGGNYRSVRHLLPNSRYIAVVLAGRTFRQTYQELQFNNRSKTNYPLAVVPLGNLVAMVRAAKEDDTSGLEAGTAEILARIVAPTGQTDPNGDLILAPIPNVEIAVVDAFGDEVLTRAYFDDEGEVDPDREQTGAKGAFLAFGLTPGVYTVIATDPITNETIDRKSLLVYANGVHLVELVQASGEIVLGVIRDPEGNTITPPQLSLIGENPDCPQFGEGCSLPAAGEYFVRMEQRTGGGDYSVPVSGSKRALGLSTFRLSSDGTLNNVAFAAGLGPLAVGGRLTFDIGFTPSVSLVETTGLITLPPGFSHSDIGAVLIGAAAPRGEAFIGADIIGFFPGKVGPGFRVLSLPPEGALSYFVTATARNNSGASSLIQVQGLPGIPIRQDLTLPDPPRLLSPVPPAPEEEAEVSENTPHLVWAAPDAGPVDLYRVTLETEEGEQLWEAWVPGSRTEITLPAFPEEAPDQLDPFVDGRPIIWRVHAIQAGGLSFQEFTFRQLAQRRVSDASAVSRFIPKRQQ
ncbi:MAG: carboxypeptidase-like regulatory domain-containing protein [Candidatus Manganitrophus sp. SB1]|nr:carboxypeptidase-like regulatory domain-containing protein [Candidatus Manganitrophus morganii]